MRLVFVCEVLIYHYKYCCRILHKNTYNIFKNDLSKKITLQSETMIINNIIMKAFLERINELGFSNFIHPIFVVLQLPYKHNVILILVNIITMLKLIKSIFLESFVNLEITLYLYIIKNIPVKLRIILGRKIIGKFP